jgi:hypothetical protein
MVSKCCNFKPKRTVLLLAYVFNSGVNFKILVAKISVVKAIVSKSCNLGLSLRATLFDSEVDFKILVATILVVKAMDSKL